MEKSPCAEELSAGVNLAEAEPLVPISAAPPPEKVEEKVF